MSNKNKQKIETEDDASYVNENDDIEDTFNIDDDEINIDNDEEYEQEDEDNENDNENDDDDDTIIDKPSDEFDYFENIDEKTIIKEEYLEGTNRISVNRLTKYEMIRILGERTKQLTMGAKPLVKNTETLSYDKIAEEELKLNMIPYKIKRRLPNNKCEIWTLDELDKEHLMSLI
jgi:DNA-directed RNA polymerase subunit K/omega